MGHALQTNGNTSKGSLAAGMLCAAQAAKSETSTQKLWSTLVWSSYKRPPPVRLGSFVPNLIFVWNRIYKATSSCSVMSDDAPQTLPLSDWSPKAGREERRKYIYT